MTWMDKDTGNPWRPQKEDSRAPWSEPESGAMKNDVSHLGDVRFRHLGSHWRDGVPNLEGRRVDESSKSLDLTTCCGVRGPPVWHAWACSGSKACWTRP